MPALELRDDEIGFYDPEAAKARRERLWGKPKPVVLFIPAKKRGGAIIYDAPIGPNRPDYRARLKNSIRETEYALSVERWRVMVAIACEKYGVVKDALFSVRREQHLVTARHDLWYAATIYCRWSLPQIGRASGGRDHTTVLHGIRRFKARMDDKVLESLILPVVKDAPLFQDQDEPDAASAAIAAE
jgi:hypothetical protein